MAVEGAESGDLGSVGDERGGEGGTQGLSGDLLRPPQHGFRGNIETAVFQGLLSHRTAGVDQAGVKEKEGARADLPLLPSNGGKLAARLDKAHEIVGVEVAGKGLVKPLEAVSLQV